MVKDFYTGGWLGLVVVMVTLHSCSLQEGCDRTIQSTKNGPKNGTFYSPGWPLNYPNHASCVIKLIGYGREKVRIQFKSFNVIGIPPQCSHDYIDIYIQADTPDQELLSQELLARKCGNDLWMSSLPKEIISLGNVLIVAFYSDGAKTGQGFEATYEFLDESLYDMGTPSPPHTCGFNIKSENRKRGVIMSPTYPGIYPDNFFCYYKLVGRPGERIRLEFKDFDIYHGGEHCPYDYIKVYDGYTNRDDVINTYCGTQFKNLVIFSTGEAMHIEFVTRSGRIAPAVSKYKAYWELKEGYDFEQRGFKAEYEFSDQFVKLDFIEGQHITGTECDQVIQSRSTKDHGSIVSPGFHNPGRYPSNATCAYFIDGMRDDQHLQKVQLTFDVFDIPTSSNDSCTDAWLAVFLHGKITQVDEPDKVLCGSKDELTATTIESAHPRMFLLFHSQGAKLGTGFQASFRFLTDYAIPGTPVSETRCEFMFESASYKEGDFNSPRHPANYPSNTTCTYYFNGLPGEQIRISFDKFLLKKDDILTIYNTYTDPERNIKVGRYDGNAGTYTPGPIISAPEVYKMKMVFTTDEEGVSQGFKGRYEFVRSQQPYVYCGANISTALTKGGLITSPNFPEKYKHNMSCEWRLHSIPKNAKIIVQIKSFALEGSLEVNCQHAVLRVYYDDPYMADRNSELCGTNMKEEKKKLEWDGDVVIFRFVTSTRSAGSKGFELAWTVVNTSEGQCDGFLCEKSKFCIHQSLKCDGVPNCGQGDNSDEDLACPKVKQLKVHHVLIGVGITLLLLLIIGICVFRKRRKKKMKLESPEEDESQRYVVSLNTNKKKSKNKNVHFMRDTVGADEQWITHIEGLDRKKVSTV